MDFRNLKYFEAVARLGNITKAATELNISQPPLSQQIQNMENEMGIKLFERHKKGVILTEEGKLLLQKVNPILRQYNELLTYLSDPQNLIMGNITVAILPFFSANLSEALAHIWEENPNIHFSIKEGHSNAIISMVQNGEAHLGITRLPIHNSELNYSILGNDPIRVVLREDDPLALKERILPKDLEGRPLILIRGSTIHNAFLQIVQMLEEAKIKPNIIGHTETSSTLLQLVKYGPGIGLAPQSGFYQSSDGLRVVPFGETDIYIPTAVIWRKNETNSIVLKLKNIISKYCVI
ncbi:DNA-binding transcriptional regulator, LysR family [Mesobacillus persicus]|uniref:DNA-binding transcriptional regulator, LysR family n=1 Tax=Mesobacillus persicus TaxID=930146 RepID=A0A1H8D8E2_9BACI|nr:LysR family transcriptional regulator [Mesobacillus persicus]SEN03425.1 DNA-binding transcriptional regulator, LysR family [Mesobacillus persicus]